MEREKYFKTLYLIGAWWNWVLAVSFIFATFFMKFSFGWFGIKLPDTFVWMHLFFILFFFMGYISYSVYLDPVKNYALGVFCIIARVVVISVLIVYFFLRAYNALIFLIIIPGSILTILSFGFIGFVKNADKKGE